MLLNIGIGVVCLLVGYFFAFFLVARDPQIFRLSEDEVIVKKPQEGLVLIAVTQAVARRIVLQSAPTKERSEALEARDIVFRDN